MSDLDRVLDVLKIVQRQSAKLFPSIPVDKALTFMGTTSAAERTLAIAPRRVRSLEATEDGKELRVRLAGALPRPPARGECVTASIADLARFRGYQVKTVNLLVEGEEARLFEASGGDTLLHGRSIYTIHESPNVLAVMERIPRDEVAEAVGTVDHAVVGVGEQANVSPRFVYHHEVRGGELRLYHGDGYAHKTYLNVRQNPLDARLLVDLESYRGYRLEGRLEEVAAHESPTAWERVAAGFAAGGWGAPLRVYCLVVSGIAAIAP